MYSPIIDTIEDRLTMSGLRCLSISRIASVIKGDLAYGNVLSPEGAFARAMITKRIKKIFLASKTYPFSILERRVWEKILDETNPKAVIAILPSRELCSVCRERGIWVADIQHGVIADEHYWYGGNFRRNDPVAWLPNAFFVWDEGSREVISSWANVKGIKVSAIGNPWVGRFREKNPADVLVQKLISKFPERANGRPNVLLSLSWGGHGLENRYIHPSLEKFVKETTDRYNWLIRLHPNQIQGFATDEGEAFVSYFTTTFGDGDVEWKSTTAMPLPLLLSRVNLHVTWLSSVCLEASYFGVRTLALSPKIQAGGDASSYYEYLSDAGYLTKAMPSLDNIRTWFESNIDKESLHAYADHSSNYEKFIMDLKDIACRDEFRKNHLNSSRK